MTQTHEQVDALLAGYALGAVTDEEAALVRSHLRECDTCTEGLAAMVEVVGTLPLAVDEVAPPPELRDRVLGIPRARRKLLPMPLRPPRVPSGPPVRLYAWAAAAVLVLALGAWNLAIQRQLSDTGTRLAQLQDQVVRGGLTGPGSRSVGSISYLSGDRLALVALHSLEPPAGGREYELWVIDAGGHADPAGVFLPEPDGTKLLVVSRPLTSGDELGVTVEPLGGSPRPSGAPFITGRL